MTSFIQIPNQQPQLSARPAAVMVLGVGSESELTWCMSSLVLYGALLSNRYPTVTKITTVILKNLSGRQSIFFQKKLEIPLLRLVERKYVYGRYVFTSNSNASDECEKAQ